MVFSFDQFLQLLGQYFWPLVRLGATMAMIPIFSMAAVPVRVRLFTVLFIVLAAAPQIPSPPPIDPFTAEGLLVMMQQVVIGLAMGLIWLVVFQAFVLAGHFISMGMGLAFASMADPINGVNVPILSQFFTILATLFFLVLNGHLLVIQVVVDSFNTLPVGVDMLAPESLKRVAAFGVYIFSAGVVMALPVVTSLLLVNLAFGIMSRAAPAMNIFAVGFPITLLAGLVLLSLMGPMILEHLRTLVHLAMEQTQALQLR